jgi:excisionase family DNA binding protein
VARDADPVEMTDQGVRETFRAGFLTPAQLARKLGCHVKTIRRDCLGGLVPAVKVGTAWRIPAGFVTDLVASAYGRMGTVGG